VADTLTEYPTVPLLLERTPKKHNVLIGNDPAQIRFAEQFLSMHHGVPVRHEQVPEVSDIMLQGMDEPKLYLVDVPQQVDLSPAVRAKTGVWSLDPIEKGGAGINAIVRHAVKLLGMEKPPKNVMAQVGYELVKDSDTHGRRYLMGDIRAAVWHAAWLLTGPVQGRPQWIAPWENWVMWMPRGGDPYYRLNALYRELVMWTFASTGDERGFRKTGGGWDSKRWAKLAALQLPKDKVYDTLAVLSAWRAHGYDPYVCAIRISKIWEIG
jgi:hypothetical protein